MILLCLAVLCWHFNARPRRWAFHAVPDALRALAATIVLFGVGGFGVVRLLLPAPLRRYELLWVLPAGGCAVGLSMTLLGFAGVPYLVNLIAVLAAGAVLGVYAVRRRGWPELPAARLGWPVFLSVAAVVIALVPMLFSTHYAVPTGNGSDAHMATGTAELLKHAYPTSVDVNAPINRMPPAWKSKYPIYYAFAGVSTLSGLQTWQVLASLAAALLGMALAGMFLVALEVFGAGRALALIAMVLAGLDRMVVHTVLHPYFNQTWGFFALPFTLVLGWWVVQPGLSRRSRQATGLLLAMFALVLIFAYPLAAPIPAVPLAAFAWGERRRRIAAGERVYRLRALYRGPRSLIWIVPVAVLLAVPAAGVLQKAIDAAKVLAPGQSLHDWSGDLFGYIPFNEFLSLPASLAALPLVVLVFYLAYRGLRDRPAPLAWGLGGLLALGVVLALYLRHRQFGYYFHFKLLAFVGPLVLLAATLGAARLRLIGPAFLALLILLTAGGVVSEIKFTGAQLNQPTIRLGRWVRSVPRNASIRLDMRPSDQLWAAYFLASRPLCSQLPLLGTDYPHVPISRKADFIIASRRWARPADAVGPPIRLNELYWMFRENPAVPGPSHCSRMRQDRTYSGAGHTWY